MQCSETLHPWIISAEDDGIAEVACESDPDNAFVLDASALCEVTMLRNPDDNSAPCYVKFFDLTGRDFEIEFTSTTTDVRKNVHGVVTD